MERPPPNGLMNAASGTLQVAEFDEGKLKSCVIGKYWAKFDLSLRSHLDGIFHLRSNPLIGGTNALGYLPTTT